MCLGRFMGLYVIIPAAVLFTMSFFVLVVVKKYAKDLKAVGYAAVAMLWLAVVLLLGAGLNVLVTGKYPFNRTMHMMSRAHAVGMCAKMQSQEGKMPCAMMQKSDAAPQAAHH